MPVDYLKIYHRMVADDLLVKVRQNSVSKLLSFYIAKLLLFKDINSNVYAFTLSPKSSPILKNKPLKTQYDYLCNYLKHTLSLYGNKYISIFETYADNENLHCHGMISFRTLEDIKKFRKDARTHFNIKLKERESDKLTHVKQLGFDTEARCRWIGYCYKELKWAIENNLNPIFRWDDLYIAHVEHPKPKTKKHTIDLFTPPIIQLTKSQERQEYIDWKNSMAQEIYDIESEEEEQTEEPQDIQEYLLYLKLKSKFEKKKPLEIL